mmetsp:Transcript_39944/g.56292  ORF Transcript_39944/g.56292 Transcript_39944/m.56292 type:complete len:94 (+) Transcript_39944:37-318(+)
MSFTAEVKTLKGKKTLIETIPLDSTVGELYDRVEQVEDTPNGKWKIMLIAKSVRTLKFSDKERPLKDYGIENGQQYRIEVILDMGACHTNRRR